MAMSVHTADACLRRGVKGGEDRELEKNGTYVLLPTTLPLPSKRRKALQNENCRSQEDIS